MSQSKAKETVGNGQQAAVSVSSQPDPEVRAASGRRRYSRAYKLRILAEAEQCQHGELGALLRREGLYYATLSKWRKQQAEGKLEGQTRQQQSEAKEQARELRRLERENARLTAQLAKAEVVIEVQKKLSALLAIVDEQDERNPNR
jgi:transposase